VDEQQLIARAVAGDPAAERQLFDAHVDRVYRLAYRMSGDAMAAQEYTQETFVRAFAHLPKFRGDSALGTWLHAIATSVTLNGLRRLKRRRNREVALETIADTAHHHHSDPDPLLQRRLTAAIDALSDENRAVLIMHDVEGYTHEEIGAALGVPSGTSKARLSRTREALRTALRANTSRSTAREHS
jgi:RNA polymerase sigma-70 factor (ECF subfamily)